MIVEDTGGMRPNGDDVRIFVALEPGAPELRGFVPRRDRRRRISRRSLCDQLFLPMQTLHLPSAERGKDQDGESDGEIG